MLPLRLPARYHEVVKRLSMALFAVSVLLGAVLFLLMRPQRDLVQELASEDPEIVVAAARQMYVDSVNGVDFGPRLAEGLRHPSARVRARCLRTLARFNLNSQADAVVPLLNDTDESVRIQAAVALRDLRGYRDPQALVAVFRDRGQPDRVRVDVAWSLAERGEKSAVAEFTAVAADDTEPVRVRMEAVRGLATLRVEAQIPLLIGLVLDEGADLRLRRCAMVSLGRLPSPEARELARQVLADGRQPAKLRGDAAQALGCHADPANVPFLTRYLDPPHDLLVRMRAAHALVYLKAPPPGLAALVGEGLASPDASVRSETACMAAQIADPQILAMVKEAASREKDGKVKCDLDNAVCRLEHVVQVDPDSALDPDTALVP